MSERLRKWFRVGQHRSIIILVDFENHSIDAWIENSIKENDYPCWTPNQDEALYEFVAVTKLQKKAFSYNPHDFNTAEEAMKNAMIWVEEILGPPVKYMSRWKLYLRLLEFWKYKPILKSGRVVGLIPRASGYTLEDFNKL